jgi:cytochrome P450 family 71 subfamily A
MFVETLHLQAHELFAGLVLALVTALLCKQLLLTPFKRRSTTSDSLPLPRPRGLPLIGNLHQLGALPHASLAELAAEPAAPLMLLRLGSAPALVVSSADALRAAFQHNDRALSGRPALYAAARLSYGLQNISFAPPDAFWRAARRACLSELLGAPRVRPFRDVRVAEAAALVAAVTEESQAGSPVNLSDMLLATSNKVVRRIDFGDGSEASIESRTVLEETQKLLGAFFVADYVPWLGWVDALRGLRRQLERNFRDLDAFYERVIDEHINQRVLSKEEDEDLVDVLLQLHGDPAHRSTFASRNRIEGILTVSIIRPCTFIVIRVGK